MKAVVLRAPGDVGVDDVPDPAILDEGDAIVAVRATAICGADLFPFHGLTPGFEAGTVLGHEFAGEILEVGPGVRGLQQGQRVVNTSMISDGPARRASPAGSRSAKGARSSATRAYIPGSTAARPRSSGSLMRTARSVCFRTASPTRRPYSSPTSFRPGTARSSAAVPAPVTPSSSSAAGRLG